MSFTYTTLKQAIQDFTDNNETTFVNNLDIFIKTAEERILKSVDLDFFRKNATATINSSDPYVATPPDYLASFSLSLTPSSGLPAGNKFFLLQKDVNFLQEYWPDSTVEGVPKYYSVFDIDNFIVAPTPSVSYQVELHYYYRPESIVDTTSGESWLGTNAPNTLLYACLVEAYIFMKGETDVITMYNDRYAESVTRLKNYGEGVENTDAYREGLVRIPKS